MGSVIPPPANGSTVDGEILRGTVSLCIGMGVVGAVIPPCASGSTVDGEIFRGAVSFGMGVVGAVIPSCASGSTVDGEILRGAVSFGMGIAGAVIPPCTGGGTVNGEILRGAVSFYIGMSIVGAVIPPRTSGSAVDGEILRSAMNFYIRMGIVGAVIPPCASSSAVDRIIFLFFFTKKNKSTSRIKTNEQGSRCTFDKGAETAHCAAERTNIRRVTNFMSEEVSYQGCVNAVAQQERGLTSHGFRLGPLFILPKGLEIAVRPGRGLPLKFGTG